MPQLPVHVIAEYLRPVKFYESVFELAANTIAR